MITTSGSGWCSAALASDRKVGMRISREPKKNFSSDSRPAGSMIAATEGGKAQLLRYATSGDVAPMRDVVGYGSVAIRGARDVVATPDGRRVFVSAGESVYAVNAGAV